MNKLCKFAFEIARLIANVSCMPCDSVSMAVQFSVIPYLSCAHKERDCDIYGLLGDFLLSATLYIGN